MAKKDISDTDAHEPEIQSKPRGVAGITGELIHAIETIRFSFGEFSELMKSRHKEKTSEFISYITAYGANAQPSNGGVSVEIPVAKSTEFSRLFRDFRRTVDSDPFMRRGLILVLISKWDAFIASLLRWMIDSKPEILNGSGRTVQFSDLKKYKSIDEAREKIIEDEIGSVIRESHVAQFEYLEKKLGTTLRKDPDVWPRFVELTQRRHLFSHTDGFVSGQYLKICEENNCKIKSSIKAGDRVRIDEKYFLDACDCLTELGIKLAQVVWRRLLPDELPRAENYLLLTSLELISSEQYVPAVNILRFAMKSPMKFIESRSRLVAVINLSQALKWRGDEEECHEILGREDWSAVSDDFLLAVAVLKDSFSEAKDLMIKIGASGGITKQDYDEWPLFRNFRSSPEYLDAYKQLFGTETETRQVPEAAVASQEASEGLSSATRRRGGRTRPKSSPPKLSDGG